MVLDFKRRFSNLFSLNAMNFFNRNGIALNFGLTYYMENSDEFEEYFEWALIIYLRRVRKENKLSEFRLDSISAKIIQRTIWTSPLDSKLLLTLI